MEGEESLERFSPEVMVQDPKIKDAASLLPPFTLFHGTADYSIPSHARSLLSFITSLFPTFMPLKNMPYNKMVLDLEHV